MADGRLDSQWDIASALLSQLANIGQYVWRKDFKKVFTPMEWNPRREQPKRDREAEEKLGPDGLTNGMQQLKILVTGGKVKPR